MSNEKQQNVKKDTRNVVYNKPYGYFDRERMDEILNSPFYTLPQGLSRQEIVEYFRKIAKEENGEK